MNPKQKCINCKNNFLLKSAWIDQNTNLVVTSPEIDMGLCYCTICKKIVGTYPDIQEESASLPTSAAVSNLPPEYDTKIFNPDKIN